MNRTVAVRLSDFLPPKSIEVDIHVSSKPELLEHLAVTASRDLGIDTQRILSRLRSREALGSTGVGSGIALPHSADIAVNAGISCCEADDLAWPYVRLTRLARPIDFDAFDDVPVDIVLMVLVPAGKTAPALRILSAAARLLRSPRFCAAVRTASTSQQIYTALVNEEIFSNPPAGDVGRAA